MDENPILGITMGDAAGIGPELILKTFLKRNKITGCRPIIIGSLDVMEWYRRKFNLVLEFNPVKKLDMAAFDSSVVDILDTGEYRTKEVMPGNLSKEYGKEAVKYTMQAANFAMEGLIDGMVSAPLNKEAMRMAGYHYEGQTQILGEMAGSKRYGMILLLDNIRVMMLTTHLSLMDACRKVTRERVYDMIRLAHESLTGLGIKNPVIGVSALNPHAGDGGLFGNEETKAIIPAIEKARSEGLIIEGPVPADVIFVNAKKDAYDIVLCMYHDQANMAAKLMGFGNVVTLVAGIPFIRTSVGHGTAFDIAGTWKADETNFIAAINQAANLALNRR